MQIGLDGTGFLFLGFPDNQAQASGMSFTTKETRSGKTWFSFKALKLGTFDLDFVQQDNTAGTSQKETVRVHVVNDKDFTSAVQAAPAQDGSVTGAVETGDPVFADKLAGLGAPEAAITELLKGYRDGNPSVNEQLAQLYTRIGSWDAAARYWQKNLAAGAPWGDAAVVGLVRAAAVQKDQVALLAQLKRFEALSLPGAEEPTVMALRMERDLNQVGIGLDLATHYLARWPEGKWMDEVEFTAAQLLEADSAFRDIVRARDLYRDIVATYPVGDFAGPARERLQYIERHFLQVR
jgi:hypothetical protein